MRQLSGLTEQDLRLKIIIHEDREAELLQKLDTLRRSRQHFQQRCETQSELVVALRAEVLCHLLQNDAGSGGGGGGGAVCVRLSA